MLTTAKAQAPAQQLDTIVTTKSFLKQTKSPQPLIIDDNTTKTPVLLNKERLEDYKIDEAYHYKDPEANTNWWTQFTHWIHTGWNNFWQWVFGNYQPQGFIGFVVKILPYLLLAGVIIFIIWLFIKLNPGAKIYETSTPPQVFFTEEEDIIKNKNIDALITQALQEENYRLAIRYQYLKTLKKLTQATLISYEFDKTNSDYFKEIANQQLNDQFKKVTTLYDYSWYGNFNVTKASYNKAQQDFKKVENLISSTA